MRILPILLVVAAIGLSGCYSSIECKDGFNMGAPVCDKANFLWGAPDMDCPEAIRACNEVTGDTD